jgi:GT2 family glycosyltransferase
LIAVPTPLYSIVIVTYGKREVTERCLDSLTGALGSTLGHEAELVLVDNASPDDTAELFEAWRDRATVVLNESNLNFSGGCNAGAAAARGEILVFLNNDTIVEPGALEALVAQAREPGVGAAGLRLHYPDGTLQHAGVGMIRVPSGHVVPHHLFHHQPGELAAARVTYDLDAVTAACLAIPRALFGELGGYDEGYANGWEDVDLCLRVRVAGRRIVYRGDLWLWHDEGQTRGQVLGADANAQRFYARWGAILDPDDELVARVFGARLPSQRSAAPLPPASIGVLGPITGTSPDAAEARGLIAACRAAAGAVAAREPLFEMVRADLSADEDQAVWEALGRPAHSDAICVQVPYAGSDPAPGTVLRLAAMPSSELPEQVPAIWAASPRLCEQLTAAGLDPSRVAWLPPCVPTGPAGPGGEGVLCILPGHDIDRSRHVIEALAEGPPPWRIRVLPTAASIPLLTLVAERLPRAELLTPCPSDERLRELCLTADTVWCADPDDAFERGALVAAGAGAAVVCSADGPAQAVLGELTQTGDRAMRAEAVARLCSEAACGDRIAERLGIKLPHSRSFIPNVQSERELGVRHGGVRASR